MKGRTQSSTQVMIDQISQAVISERPGHHQAGKEIIADTAGNAGLRGRTVCTSAARSRRFLVDICHGGRSYSTVTDFARLRGWSTSVPMRTAV